jgi:hypothetical protein
MSNNNTNPDNKTPNPGTKDALKAENDALKAELEALKAQQAEKDAAAKAELEALMKVQAAAKEAQEETAAPVEEREEIFVPRGYANDEPNMIIAVNGVNYVLPRGETSNVPKFIAEEFHRSQKAQSALDKRVNKMLDASKQ